MSVFSPSLTALARDVVDGARGKKLRIVTAESCTGGLVAACLTEIPGSSDVLDRGFITYSNDSKMAQLSVERKTLADFGAVSPAAAMEMASGALRASHADISVAITGIAGPGGGTADKPVGLVYIAVGDQSVTKHNFTGDRAAVRLAAVEAALGALKEEIEKS
jgi:nicotinamide-nucleotide amidase